MLCLFFRSLPHRQEHKLTPLVPKTPTSYKYTHTIYYTYITDYARSVSVTERLTFTKYLLTYTQNHIIIHTLSLYTKCNKNARNVLHIFNFWKGVQIHFFKLCILSNKFDFYNIFSVLYRYFWRILLPIIYIISTRALLQRVSGLQTVWVSD